MRDVRVSSWMRAGMFCVCGGLAGERPTRPLSHTSSNSWLSHRMSWGGQLNLSIKPLS